MLNNIQNVNLPVSSVAEIIAEILSEMEKTMGDMAEEILAELAPILIEDTPMMLAQISQAIDVGDALQVKKTSHTLKGSCASMGITVLAGYCRELEAMGIDGQLETAADKLAQTEAEYEQVKKALEPYL